MCNVCKCLLNRKDIPHLCFSYDTTFKLGDIYVSILIVRFQEMEEAPVIPLMFMLEEFPELLTATNIYFVTDEETAIVNAIKKFLPNIDCYRCWNHLVTNAKLKLDKLKITGKQDVAAYVKDLFSLFGKKTHQDYLLTLNDIYSDQSRWHAVSYPFILK